MNSSNSTESNLNESNFCVLTGDLVGSRQLDLSLRPALLSNLKQFLKDYDPELRFELFRGDGFQILVQPAQKSLELAIYLRCRLKSMDLPRAKPLDSRIGIGWGPIEALVDTLAESDGTAFRNAALALEKASNFARLAIISGNSEQDQHWWVNCLLLEAIMDHWSVQQAEVVAMNLLNYNQSQIGTAFGITQSAVNHRLRSARWEAIPPLLQLFEEQIGRSGKLNPN